MANTFLNFEYEQKTTRLPVKPTMSLAECVNEFCRASGVDSDSSRLALTHQGHPLDMSLQLRYANLTPNARLQVVPASTDPITVTVAVQTPSRQRVQGFVDGDCTLLEMLRQLEASQPESFTQNTAGRPVLQFEQRKLSDVELGRTLRYMGFGDGSSVLFRLSFEPVRVPEPVAAAAAAAAAAAPSSSSSSSSTADSAVTPMAVDSTVAPASPGTIPRQAGVYRVPAAVGAVPDPDESDDFFEVTPEDLLLAADSLASRVHTTFRRRGGPTTEDTSVVPTTIRVKFGNGLMLQATYRSDELVRELFDFVRGHLRDPWTPFCLAIPTSKSSTVTDEALTFRQAGLVPSTVVVFKSDAGSAVELLKPEVLEEATTPPPRPFVAQPETPPVVAAGGSPSAASGSGSSSSAGSSSGGRRLGDPAPSRLVTSAAPRRLGSRAESAADGGGQSSGASGSSSSSSGARGGSGAKPKWLKL